MQFTINRVLFKIFGAMAKDSYLEISSHFGIDDRRSDCKLGKNDSVRSGWSVRV